MCFETLRIETKLSKKTYIRLFYYNTKAPAHCLCSTYHNRTVENFVIVPEQRFAYSNDELTVEYINANISILPVFATCHVIAQLVSSTSCQLQCIPTPDLNAQLRLSIQLFTLLC